MESSRLQAQLEERRRFPLEERLRERIIGQDGAITTTAAGTTLTLSASSHLLPRALGNILTHTASRPLLSILANIYMYFIP